MPEYGFSLTYIVKENQYSPIFYAVILYESLVTILSNQVMLNIKSDVSFTITFAESKTLLYCEKNLTKKKLYCNYP